MKKAERKKVDIADIVVKVIIWLLGILLALYALSIIVMLLWGLLTSLKSHTDFGVPGNNVIGFPNLDPNDPSNSRQQFFFWENYTKIYTKATRQALDELFEEIKESGLITCLPRNQLS